MQYIDKSNVNVFRQNNKVAINSLAKLYLFFKDFEIERGNLQNKREEICGKTRNSIINE